MTTLLRSFRRSILATLPLCATALTGCIAIPVPIALSDPEPFTAESMESIRIGETNRDEVRALLADWPYENDDGIQTAHLEPQVSEEGRYWVFTLWRERGSVLWVGLALPDGATLPVLAPFTSGGEEKFEDFWALFEFGDDATIARYWIAGDRTPCAVGGACYYGSHLQIMADEAADLSARAASPASDRCIVYAYASDDFEWPVAVADGSRTGWLFEKTSFVRFDVAPGAALPSVEYENVPGSVVTMPINCAGGAVHYVALRPRDGVIEAVPERPSVGGRAIKRRYLVERLVPVQSSHCAREVAARPRWVGPCLGLDSHR